MSEAAIAGWSVPRRKTRGGQRQYSDLPVLDHTTLSRRCANLVVSKSARHDNMNADLEPVHVVIDSTGLKGMVLASGLKTSMAANRPDNGANCISR